MKELDDFVEHFLTHDWSAEFDLLIANVVIEEGVGNPVKLTEYCTGFGVLDSEVERLFENKSVDELVKLYVNPALEVLAKSLIDTGHSFRNGISACYNCNDTGIRQTQSHGGRVSVSTLVNKNREFIMDCCVEELVDDDKN